MAVLLILETVLLAQFFTTIWGYRDTKVSGQGAAILGVE